jgi:serine/threonine-protein kinase PknG
MTRCQIPGCGGPILDGFCDQCGRPASPPRAASPNSDSTDAASSPQGSRDSVRGRIGGELVDLPPEPEPDPTSLVLSPDQAVVPEAHRTCVNGHEVGRFRAGRPGLTEGFCPTCGTQFSFEARLGAGDRLGRYQVVGPLAHGGVGWVYLAKDTNLDGQWVVLKGLINNEDPDARAAFVRERQFLTLLDHPNIVRILDFATHPDSHTDYMVMEFVRGRTLHAIAKERRREIAVETVIGYGLAILDALDYLHSRGLLYCDLKPDNVMHGSRVRLIDMGAVRRITDHRTPSWGAERFTVSKAEVREHNLTVRSDLFAVGRTLTALFAGTRDHDLGDTGDARISVGVASFRNVLMRAQAPFAARFDSAAEMADQLVRVRAEIRALRGESVQVARSRAFARSAHLFDAGLGAVPQLTRWTAAPASEDAVRGSGPQRDGRPEPAVVAVGLADPLIDPADPAAAELAAVSATDAHRLLAELAKLPLSVETALWRCRAHLALGDVAGVALDLSEARELGAGDGAVNWRIVWHEALDALARGQVARARGLFQKVRAAMPGESVPKLALAFCAECLAEDEAAEARAYYHAVWQADRTEASAAFGLARLALAAGDRGAAVRVLDQVPTLSRHYDAARVAAVRARVGAFPTTRRPVVADLHDAALRLAKLTLDQDARWRLVTVLRQAAFAAIREHDWSTVPIPRQVGLVYGDPVTAPGLRRLLESAFRELSRQAVTAGAFGTLIDLANTVRPRTWT